MFLFIGSFFKFEGPVVDGSAYIQGLQEFAFLGFMRIESVLEGFTHIPMYSVFIDYYERIKT